MRIHFVRHGETDFNAASIYQGHTDTHLSVLGRSQAAAVGERFRDMTVDVVYSSDLSRASETGHAIADHHGLEVQEISGLRECSFGEWEGLSVTEIREQYPELYRNYIRDSFTYRAPGGERLEKLQDRVVRAVNEIAERHTDDEVVVATHGGPICAFICWALVAPLEDFRRIRLNNCGVTTFTLGADGGWTLESMNDICHLVTHEPEESPEYMSSDA